MVVSVYFCTLLLVLYHKMLNCCSAYSKITRFVPRSQNIKNLQNLLCNLFHSSQSATLTTLFSKISIGVGTIYNTDGEKKVYLARQNKDVRHFPFFLFSFIFSCRKSIMLYLRFTCMTLKIIPLNGNGISLLGQYGLDNIFVMHLVHGRYLIYC